jgi:hypothetical protein
MILQERQIFKMDKKSIVIVLSHHYNRREKLYDNLFKNLENLENV